MMFVLLFSFSRAIEVKPILSQESAPSFVEQGHEDDIFNDWNGRIFADTEIKSDLINTRRGLSEYLACSVSIKKAIFQNNWAFGAGCGPGNGGALLVSFCTLQIVYPEKNMDSFFNNTAMVGGALCCLYSNVYIQKAKFSENLAYRYAGSLYFQGYETREKIGVLFLQCLDTDFVSNTCNEIGGGVLLTNMFSAYFESCLFESNKAGITGGAIYSINAQAKLFECSFLSNEAGDREIRTLRSADGKISINDKISIHFRGFGGGAITFISSDIYRGKRQNRFLYTQGCCFLGNKAHNGNSFAKEGGAAHVLLFEGVCAWYSFDDYLGGGDIKNAIGHVSKEWESVLLNARYHETIDACEEHDYENFPIINDGPMTFTFAPMKNKVETVMTKYVPTPSLYVYEATQPWEQPDPTEINETCVATTFRYPSFKERTVKATAKATRDGSPDPTILYPKRTPRRTRSPSPKRTPIKSPMETIRMTPLFTPAVSPVQTPYRTPINTFMPSMTFMPTHDTPSPTEDLRYSTIFTELMSPTMTTTEMLTFTKIKTEITKPTVTKLYSKTSTVSQIYTLNSENQTIKTITEVKTYTEIATAITTQIPETLIYMPIYTNIKNVFTVIYGPEGHTEIYTLARYPSLTFMETNVSTGTYIKTRVNNFTKIDCPSLKEGEWHTVYKSTKTTILSYTKNEDGEFVLKYYPNTISYIHQHMTHEDKCEDITYFTKVNGYLTKTITTTYFATNTSAYTFIPYPDATLPPQTASPSASSEYLITSTRYSLIPTSTFTLAASYVNYTTKAETDTITEILLPSIVFTSTFTMYNGWSEIYTLTGVNVYTNVVTFFESGAEFIEFSETFVSQSTTIETMKYLTRSYKGAYGSSTIAEVPSLFYSTTKITNTFTLTDLVIPYDQLPTKTNIFTECATPTSTFTFISYFNSEGKEKTTVTYTLTTVYSYKQTRVMISELTTKVLTKADVDEFIAFLPSTTNVTTIIETAALYPPQTPLPTAILPTANTLMYGESYTDSYVPVCSSTFVEIMTILGSTVFKGYTGVYVSTSIYSSTFTKGKDDSFIYTYTLVPEMTYVPTKTNGDVVIYTKEYTYTSTCVEKLVHTKSNCILKSPVYSQTVSNVNTFSSCVLMGTVTMIQTERKFKKHTFVSILTQVDTYIPTVAFTNVKTLVTENNVATFKDTTTVLSTNLITKTFTNVTTFISSLGMHSIWTEGKTNTNVCLTNTTKITTIAASYTNLNLSLITAIPPPQPTKNLLEGKITTYTIIGTVTKTFFNTYVKTKVSVTENPTVILTETAMYLSTWTSIKERMTIDYTYTYVSPVITETITEYAKNVKETSMLTKSYTRASSYIGSRTTTITYVDMNSFSASYVETNVPTIVCAPSTLTTAYLVTRVTLKARESTIMYLPSLTAKSTFVSFMDSYTYTFTQTYAYTLSVVIAKSNITTFIRMKSNVHTSTCVESMIQTRTITWVINPAPTRTPIPPMTTPQPTFNIYASPSYTEMVSETYTDVFTYIIGKTTYCFRHGSTYVPTIEHIFSSTWTFENGHKGKRAYKFTEMTVISDTYISTAATCGEIPTYTITSTLTYTDVPSTTLTYVTTGTNFATHSLINSLTEVFTETSVPTLTRTFQFIFQNPATIATITNIFKGTYTNVVGTRSFTYTWTNAVTETETSFRKVPTNTVINVTTLYQTKTYTDSYTKVSTLTVLIKNLPTKTALPTPKPTKARSPTPSQSRKPGQKYTLSQIITSYSIVTHIQTSYMTFTLTKTNTILNGIETVVIVPTSKLTAGLSEIYTVTVGASQVGFDTVDISQAEANANSLVVIIAATVSGIILVIIISLLVWFFVGYSRSSSSSDSGVNLDEISLLHVPNQEQPPMTHENPLWTKSVMGENDDPFRNDFEEVTAEGFFNERAETVDSDP